MYRGGKPTASRVSTNIQKPTSRLHPSTGVSNGSSSGTKGSVITTTATPSTPKSSRQQASGVRSSSSSQPSQPQPSKSPSNIGKNINNIHFNNHRSSEDKFRESNNSKIMEEEDDDDMEIMSVNDQHQYLKDFNKPKDQNSSIKSIRSSRSSKSSRSNLSEIGMSDDSIPLKLKKKVQIETPRERELRDSRDSSIHSTPMEEHDEYFGEEQSVLSSNNSLHILSSVRKKLKDEEEDQQPVNNNPRPSKIAEYIKRFRTAPPTQRSERKRLEFDDEKEEPPVPISRNERRRSPEMEPMVTNSREDNRSWMKRMMQGSVDSSHPSIRNINQMKESIKQEIMDVEENIELAKRYSQFDMEDEETLEASKDQFPYMDTLDFNINELNNITDLALENGSFKMFGNVESILSKLSNEKTNSSKDSTNSEKRQNEDISDSSDEEQLDEMFRKGVLSRLQSIGLHESYLDLESYDILGSNEKPKIEKAKIDKVDELMREREQVEKLIQGKISSRENSIVREKEREEPKLARKDSNVSKQSSFKDSIQSTLSEEKSPSKYEISIDHEDMEEGFFPVVTIKSDKSVLVVSQSMESLESINSGFESRQLDFVDEEELIQRQGQNELTPPTVTQSIDSLLAKSIESVSSVSSANDNDMSTMGYCQRMIEQMVSSEPELEPEQEKQVLKEKPIEKKSEIDVNDDNNEIFTSDYICQTLRQKIDQLKNRLAELEKKDSLLK